MRDWVQAWLIFGIVVTIAITVLWINWMWVNQDVAIADAETKRLCVESGRTWTKGMCI